MFNFLIFQTSLLPYNIFQNKKNHVKKQTVLTPLNLSHITMLVLFDQTFRK